MKKKGAALVTVLVIFTALIIIATSISSAVINSAKLNKRYSENIDLELAAKSGVNIIKEDFISKVNSKEINTLDKVNEYIKSITSQQNINNLIKEYSNNNITLTLNLTLVSTDGKNVLKMTSTAKNEDKVSVEKIEQQSLVLDIKENTIDYDLSIFKNYINISNDIEIGANNQNTSYTKNSAYGNSCNVQNNSSGYQPKYEPDLKNIVININRNELSNINNNFISDKVESLNTNSNIEITNKEYIKYDRLNMDNKSVLINNSKIMFDGASNCTNLNTFSEIINSTVVFNGDFISNNKINMKVVQNSIIIVNGNLKVQNGLNMNNFENSILIVTGDLEMPTIENSQIINLSNSIIIIGGKLYAQNSVNINLNNSILMTIGNFELDNGINGTSNNSSLICGGNMVIKNTNNNFTCTGKTYPENTDVLRRFYKYALVL